ncbi:MAG: ABC transporter ATP-binding protein, partial [Acetobacteraceae bacterium]
TDLLRIVGLTVRHGATETLSGLDLAIRRGELFVLLGGSGSGKTTLLRAIAGFVTPAAGRIELDGADLGPLPPHRRKVNTMFQSYALFPHMTVLDNVAFGLRQQGMAKQAAASRAAEMLALVRLDGVGQRRPHQLSGGQQQRVALARALAPNPSLLLLDEPLSALDRALRAETRAELVRLNRELGMTFILVTHDQEEALTMADRIGIMRFGRMAQVGTPEQVYERPADRFVADFVGAANLLPCVVRPDGVTADLPALGATILAETLGKPGPGWLAVRAERLRIGDASRPNQLTGTLVARAYAGEAVSWSVRLRDGTVLRVAQSLQDGLTASGEPSVGDSVTLSWHPRATILLPE